jgi:hypothetical protein
LCPKAPSVLPSTARDATASPYVLDCARLRGRPAEREVRRPNAVRRRGDLGDGDLIRAVAGVAPKLPGRVEVARVAERAFNCSALEIHLAEVDDIAVVVRGRPDPLGLRADAQLRRVPAAVAEEGRLKVCRLLERLSGLDHLPPKLIVSRRAICPAGPEADAVVRRVVDDAGG